jgi:hypothetical protein
LNCKHWPNVCKFLLGFKAKFWTTAFAVGAERCGRKTFSILSNTGVCVTFHSFPLSPFHHLSSVYMLSCLSSAKRFFIHSSFQSFIETLVYLSKLCTLLPSSLLFICLQMIAVDSSSNYLFVLIVSHILFIIYIAWWWYFMPVVYVTI